MDKLAPATTALLRLVKSSTPADRCSQTLTFTVMNWQQCCFTSGTEGMSKGVMLTHNNILAAKRAYCARLNLTADVFLMPAPLGHATGFLRRHRTLLIRGA